MQKKYKMQKMVIALIAFLLAVIIVGMLFGRLDQQSVVRVKVDLDITKTLGEQSEFLEIVEVSKDDYKKFEGMMATSLEEVQNKKALYELKAGSMVPLGALTEEGVGGKFAQAMPKKHTIYTIPNGAALLPGGLVENDKIDIALYVTAPNGDKKDDLTEEELEDLKEWQKKYPELLVGMLLRDVEVFAIDGANLHLKVTQKEHLQLSMAANVGTFILQLPGKKDVELCTIAQSRVERELRTLFKQEEKEEEEGLSVEKTAIRQQMEGAGFTKEKIERALIDEFVNIEKTDEKVLETRRQELIKEQEEEYIQYRVKTVECYNDEDSAEENITKEQILETLLKNGIDAPDETLDGLVGEDDKQEDPDKKAPGNGLKDYLQGLGAEADADEKETDEKDAETDTNEEIDYDYLYGG